MKNRYSLILILIFLGALMLSSAAYAQEKDEYGNYILKQLSEAQDA